MSLTSSTSSASAASSGAPIWAHLLRWLSRGSLRRRRPTPQSPLPSPPRIWTHLGAPLCARPSKAHLLLVRSRGAAAARLVAHSLRRRRPTPQSRDSSPPRIWTHLGAPLPARPIKAHLLLVRSRGAAAARLVAHSLRRRRPTPQSPLPSPPRIWAHLGAPLCARPSKAHLLL